MNQSILQRVQQCHTLPTLPAIAVEVLNLTQSDEANLTEIARVISKDPALTSKILKTVNSSFYGRSQSISTVSRAMVILGLQSVKTLALSFSLVNSLSGKRSSGFPYLAYWRHSLFAATASRIIAGDLKIVQQEECFLAALIMDIGMLILNETLGDQYQSILSAARTHQQLVELEKRELDMTHADVMGHLARQWKLPPLLVEPMANHHNHLAVADPSLRRLTKVVQMASLCADVFVEKEAGDAISTVKSFGKEHFNMNESSCDTLLENVGRRTREVASFFEINIGSTSSYESILKRANEALVHMTLQSQQQATTLVEQNQELKKQACTDGLTSLTNRATFDQSLATMFRECAVANKSLALLMLDVDKFKSINDTHGHQVGDQVLRYVARVVQTAARQSDVAARYGGEEIVLLMPHTTRTTATATAEMIRRALAARAVKAGSVTVPVTASIGVAVYDPSGLFKEPAHLLKAADMSVYAAKHAGRNCVRAFSPPKPAAA